MASLQADLSARRLGRAGKLTALLNDELLRWGEEAEALSDKLSRIVGDAFLSAAVISYMGAFTGVCRAGRVEYGFCWAVVC